MQRFSWPDPPRQTAYPIARPGWPFIGAAAFATVVLALLGLKLPAVLMLVVAACICAFFRDPDRVIPEVEGCVVSPADGKIIVCEKVAASDYYAGECLKISIFMSVFNVHVNRMVHDGRIGDVAYHPGKFFFGQPGQGLPRERAQRPFCGHTFRPAPGYRPDCRPDCTPHHLWRPAR